MKKFLLVFLAIAMVGTYVFAEDATLEERVAALEAAPAITATGSLDFSIGDSNLAEGPVKPVFTAKKSATATLELATADDKVSGSIVLDLMPSVTSTVTSPSVPDAYSDVSVLDALIGALAGSSYFVLNVENYNDWLALQDEVAWWNAHAADKIGSSTTSIWGSNDGKTLLADLDSTATKFASSKAKASKIVLKSLVAKNAKTNQIVVSSAVLSNASTTESSFSGDLSGFVNAAIDKITDTASNAGIKNVTSGSDLETLLSGWDYDTYKDVSAADRKILKQAADLWVSYSNIAKIDTDATVASTLSLIKSASLTVKEIGGVVDLTANFGNQHVAAGSINVDGSGQSSTEVKAYPSVSFALSSGVVEGVTAGATLYIDDNAVKAPVTDKWYTWLDESAGTPAEPTYGYGFNAGYSTTVSDMTVGASVEFGMYGSDYAFAVKPSFAGMGATVDAEFDYSADVMFANAKATYTIMGIVPYVDFYYDKGTLVYAATPASVLAGVKNGDKSMALGGGASVALDDFIGMPASVDFGVISDFTNLGWNASVSVTPVDALTIKFGADADQVEGSTFDYSVGLEYTYSSATFYAAYGSDYSSTLGDVVSYGAGVKVSF